MTTCDSPDTLESFQLPTTYAVLALIEQEDGTIILGERGPAANGGWGELGAPGGGIDQGENAVQALDRELHEEAALRLLSAQPFAYTSGVYELRNGPGRVVVFYFLVKAEGTPVTREPEKCLGWNRYAWDALPDNTFPGILEVQSIRPKLLPLLPGTLERQDFDLQYALALAHLQA
jgi:8-oxo-dGTP diphosphatase